MHTYYKKYFDITSKHKKRQKNDMQPQFSYIHWLRWVIEINFLVNITINFLLREAPQSVHVQVDNETYKYEFGSQAEHPIAYISYYNNMKKNKPILKKQLENKKTKVWNYSENIQNSHVLIFLNSVFMCQWCDGSY